MAPDPKYTIPYHQKFKKAGEIKMKKRNRKKKKRTKKKALSKCPELKIEVTLNISDSDAYNLIEKYNQQREGEA